MSFPLQHIFTISPKCSTAIYLTTITNPSHKTLNLPPQSITTRHLTTFRPKFCTLHHQPPKPLNFKTYPSPLLRAYENDSSSTATLTNENDHDFNLDSFLSMAEFLCLITSAIISVATAVSFTVLGPRYAFLGEMAKRAIASGCMCLVGGVAIGAWIRRRQWRRICRETAKGEKLNLIERIEKLEEDLKSSATIVRVLSRQLEKLGIRFRVTRKALKDPIAETAALAQRNSEGTRALAVQGDILEKELGEIQKVLLAMQEQQQKQLDLILTIAKNGNLWENKKQTSSKEEAQDVSGTSNYLPKQDKQKETLKAQPYGTS